MIRSRVFESNWNAVGMSLSSNLKYTNHTWVAWPAKIWEKVWLLVWKNVLCDRCEDWAAFCSATVPLFHLKTTTHACSLSPEWPNTWRESFHVLPRAAFRLTSTGLSPPNKKRYVMTRESVIKAKGDASWMSIVYHWLAWACWSLMNHWTHSAHAAWTT